MVNMMQIQQEIMKYMIGNNASTSANEAGCVGFNDYTGFKINFYSSNMNDIIYGTWVIDTGATTHVCTTFLLSLTS